jgi:DNA-binding NarL/FixJ family response regulator
MKVFIADGSKLGLRRLLMLLSDIKEFELFGYSAEINGAIVSIRSIRPHVVILDLEMRGGNGIEVLKTIKREMPEVIFLIVTNSASESYRTHCKELGAEFFFDKSTEFSRIPDTLTSLVAQLSRKQQKEVTQ